MALTPAPRGQSRHALRSDMLDLITDGVSLPRTPVAAARKTALSARRLGWTRVQWSNQLIDGAMAAPGQKPSHVLWDQLQRHSTNPYKLLDNIWEQARKHIEKDPANKARARARARAWARLARTLDLTDTQQRVLGWVIAKVTETGFARVNCAHRTVATNTGLTRTTALETLDDLTGLKILVRYSRGRPGKKGEGKAARYGLANPASRRIRRLILRCSKP